MNDKKQLYYELTALIIRKLEEIKLIIEEDWEELDDGKKWREEE